MADQTLTCKGHQQHQLVSAPPQHPTHPPCTHTILEIFSSSSSDPAAVVFLRRPTFLLPSLPLLTLSPSSPSSLLLLTPSSATLSSLLTTTPLLLLPLLALPPLAAARLPFPPLLLVADSSRVMPAARWLRCLLAAPCSSPSTPSSRKEGTPLGPNASTTRLPTTTWFLVDYVKDRGGRESMEKDSGDISSAAPSSTTTPHVHIRMRMLPQRAPARVPPCAPARPAVAAACRGPPGAAAAASPAPALSHCWGFLLLPTAPAWHDSELRSPLTAEAGRCHHAAASACSSKPR